MEVTHTELQDATTQIEEAIIAMREALEMFNDAAQVHAGCHARSQAYCSSIIAAQIGREGSYEMFTMEDAQQEMQAAATEAYHAHLESEKAWKETRQERHDAEARKTGGK